MNLYAEQIIDLYKNPLNKRELRDADITGSGANVICGDHVRMYVKLNGQKTVRDASFEGVGCAISIAAASLLTEEVKNKSLEEIEKMKTEDIFELLGTELGPSRVKCGVLCLETLQSAIAGNR